MQKLRIVQVDQFEVGHIDVEPVEHKTVESKAIAAPASSARADLRLANASDVSVIGPARQLQNDLAHAFAADAGWSVKRTVIVGLVFHAVVLGSLALAASNLVPHLAR